MVVSSIALLLALTGSYVPSQPIGIDRQFAAPVAWLSQKQVSNGRTYWVFRDRYGLSGPLGDNARPVDPKRDSVSVAELSLWRSPRGLDYRFEHRDIDIWPYDHSGKAVVDLKTGRCVSAEGNLSDLRNVRLDWVKASRITYLPYNDQSDYLPYLTLSRRDLLLPMSRLHRYWGEWANLKASNLTYYPTSDIPVDGSGNIEFDDRGGIEWLPIVPNDPIYAIHKYSGETTLPNGLNCRVVLVRQAFSESTGTIRDAVYIIGRNQSKERILFQMQRLAPIYDDSLPCWFDRFVPKVGHFDEPDLPTLMVEDRHKDTRLSVELKPHEVETMMFFTSPGKVETSPPIIPFRYADGYYSVTFQLHPGKPGSNGYD